MSTPTKAAPGGEEDDGVGGFMSRRDSVVPRSLLKTGGGGLFARRVEGGAAAPPSVFKMSSALKQAGAYEPASAAKEMQPLGSTSAFKSMGNTMGFSRGLEHYTLFEKVQALEAEASALRQHVRELRTEKQELAERLQAASERLDGVCRGSAGAGGGDGDALLTQAQGGDLHARLALLQQELANEQRDRRAAHNALVDLRGSIRVYARVRPAASPTASSSAYASGAGGALAVAPAPDGRTLSVNVSGATHGFAFNSVLGPGATQAQVFSEVSELVQSSLDGYSVCIFSYGQTGSGKTYSMAGGAGDGRGLVPRAIERILHSVDRLRLQEWTYSVSVSVLEIYNERLRDLLDAGSKEVSDINAIRHDAGGHASVSGVRSVGVTSAAHAMSLIAAAHGNRSTNATAMNATSSRSHCVTMFAITGSHGPSGMTLTGSLSMVDLAGSERLDRSLAEGQRKAEACAINASLSSLALVFDALSCKEGKRHVPYRNSKLTYLLKPALSAGGKSCMLVHVAPEAASAYESLTSLRFATKVAGVEIGQAKRRVEIVGAADGGAFLGGGGEAAADGGGAGHATRTGGAELVGTQGDGGERALRSGSSSAKRAPAAAAAPDARQPGPPAKRRRGTWL
ncbi:hypothetical protein FOA52_001242 [Chlamydomonas sp. UWO 241]|nr:hypothetical protein FOA52_001242 [Chlamydomonas sp. UWO 241]